MKRDGSVGEFLDAFWVIVCSAASVGCIISAAIGSIQFIKESTDGWLIGIYLLVLLGSGLSFWTIARSMLVKRKKQK